MHMPICSRCKKNIAVVFITKMDPNAPASTEQEGLCLKCARELGIKPLDDMMERMGITDETLSQSEILSNCAEAEQHLADMSVFLPVFSEESFIGLADGVDGIYAVEAGTVPVFCGGTRK